MSTLRVCGIAGSLRKASYNRALLRVAQELAKLALIDREGLCAPFRQGRVAVVDVVRDVAEEQG